MLFRSVWRSDVNGYGYEWRVTFHENGPVDRMVVNGDKLTGADSAVNVYERVVVTSSAQKDDISGTWTIEVADEETATMAFNVNAAGVHDELLKLDKVGAVVVTERESRVALPGLCRVAVGGSSMTCDTDHTASVSTGDKIWLGSLTGPDAANHSEELR